MNIHFPPREECPVLWRLFADWMIDVMSQSAGGPGAYHCDVYIYRADFRSHTLKFCPFCGMTLNTDLLDMRQWHGA
jgi:hypothetical protein